MLPRFTVEYFLLHECKTTAMSCNSEIECLQ